MKKRYKIGDISKLAGVPVQTLRFYEEKKLIAPIKDQRTGYRYYDAWGVTDLFDAMIARKMDFSLEQIEKQINSSSLEELSQQYMEQETKLLKTITQYQQMLRAVSHRRMSIQNFSYKLGSLQPCDSPGLVFHRHQFKSTFQTQNGSENLEALNQEMAPWLDAFPEAVTTFLIPQHFLTPGKPQDVSCWWGFSIPYDDSEKHGIQPLPPNEYLPSAYSLYTVFEAGQEGTFTTAFYEAVYEKVLAAGYVINGSPYGRTIVKTHEEDGYKRYFEVWIPIAK